MRVQRQRNEIKIERAIIHVSQYRGIAVNTIFVQEDSQAYVKYGCVKGSWTVVKPGLSSICCKKMREYPGLTTSSAYITSLMYTGFYLLR